MDHTLKAYHPIKAWLLETGTLAGDLADAIGWSSAGLSQSITDDVAKRRPIPEKWRGPLAAAMGVSVDEILGPDRTLGYTSSGVATG